DSSSGGGFFCFRPACIRTAAPISARGDETADPAPRFVPGALPDRRPGGSRADAGWITPALQPGVAAEAEQWRAPSASRGRAAGQHRAAGYAEARNPRIAWWAVQGSNL